MWPKTAIERFLLLLQGKAFTIEFIHTLCDLDEQVSIAEMMAPDQSVIQAERRRMYAIIASLAKNASGEKPFEVSRNSSDEFKRGLVLFPDFETLDLVMRARNYNAAQMQELVESARLQHDTALKHGFLPTIGIVFYQTAKGVAADSSINFTVALGEDRRPEDPDGLREVLKHAPPQQTERTVNPDLIRRSHLNREQRRRLNRRRGQR